MYEFRSDTFTRPDAAMREAMATAVVGDDVWDEDPTVHRLEARAAELVGKEAALFVSSGTMGNAIGIRLHAAQGEMLLAHRMAHVVDAEGGGAAALWGVQSSTYDAPTGVPTAAAMDAVLPPDYDDPHTAVPKLLCIENTHMASGGRPWTLAEIAETCAHARARRLAIHMDGARLFNAAVAIGVPAVDICHHVDTVQFCLSKGLGAPVGSILAGSARAMRRAKRWRKLLGGGTRQAGILAAAGLYALDHRIDRLAEDHANARRLAEGLAEMPRVAIDPDSVKTNILLVRVARDGDSAKAMVADLARAGVLGAELYGAVRLVTSSEIAASDIDAALLAASRVLR